MIVREKETERVAENRGKGEMRDFAQIKRARKSYRTGEGTNALIKLLQR